MFDPSLLSPLSPMATPYQSNQQQLPPWVPLEAKDCSQGFCTIYCPQWCYIVFPPPPPFFLDDDTSSGGAPAFSPLVIAIIGILVTASVLVGYYTIISKFCRRPRRRRANPVGPEDEEAYDDDVGRHSGRQEEWHTPPTVGLDDALIKKITACKYKRGDGLVDCSDCSVCLSEFRDDESLRLLPKCSHAFHVQCIDTWLRSHSNCPLCRANIVPVNPAPPQSPAPLPQTVTGQPDAAREDETVVVVEDSDEGSSVENGSGGGSSKGFTDAVIEVTEGQRMRRSFSMGAFQGSRVSVADILQVDMEDDREILAGGSSSQRSRGEHGKGSGLHCVSPVPMKRSVSSGRFSLTRQGRGSNAVLPL